MALKQAQCANHPDRYGHAVCMTCRKTLCQECATAWDGINYCTACLSAKRTKTKASSPALGYILVAVACALLFAIGPKLLVWGATLFQRGVGE